MKKLTLAGVVAVGLLLAATASPAEAAWAYRTVNQWNPIAGQYVMVTQRYWVPDVVTTYVAPAPVITPSPVVVASPPVITPAPVVVASPPVIVSGYYRPHIHFDRHHH